MRMLLHMCCGPCACGTIPFWQEEGLEIVGFFYNPNIHPLMEYRRRLEGARETALARSIRFTIDAAYDPEEWFAAVAGEKGSRCHRCIALRMDRSAREAVEQGCEAFSTTLAISPWQDHESIQTTGSQAGREHGLEFVYTDLRPHYRESRRISREWGLYRQQYCGCLVSEWERYRDAASTHRKTPSLPAS